MGRYVECDKCGKFGCLVIGDIQYPCEYCEEEKQAYDELQEQNSNYWKDVAGSIK